MDFVSVGINAASVGDEFCMLLNRVTSERSIEIFEKSSYDIGAKEKKLQQTKEKRKRTKKPRQLFKSEKEPSFHILCREIFSIAEARLALLHVLSSL